MSVLTDRVKLSEKLLTWWEKNQRKFPWRNTQDSYQVLISEVLLHRTKAEQVAPIYNEFLKRFPTLKDLSIASLDEVKGLLYPLGLLWRTKLLHKMSVEIVEKCGGKIPSTKKELELLPGISHYIASAVRCFAFGYAESLLDTNTVRILGRVFGIEVTDSSRRSKRFQKLSESVLDKKNPRSFNYAMIDLGALICRPRNPLCEICPLNEICRYGTSRLSACGSQKHEERIGQIESFTQD
jgi:A/G-specific adenine glycosylase